MLPKLSCVEYRWQRNWNRKMCRERRWKIPLWKCCATACFGFIYLFIDKFYYAIVDSSSTPIVKSFISGNRELKNNQLESLCSSYSVFLAFVFSLYLFHKSIIGIIIHLFRFLMLRNLFLAGVVQRFPIPCRLQALWFWIHSLFGDLVSLWLSY